LAVAASRSASSVAFPLISSGIYAWPVDDAIRIALAALAGAPEGIEVARLVLFDRPT
jgi:O-acetyl-ADP-ribose deacetylase (regulator of RNase III)